MVVASLVCACASRVVEMDERSPKTVVAEPQPTRGPEKSDTIERLPPPRMAEGPADGQFHDVDDRGSGGPGPWRASPQSAQAGAMPLAPTVVVAPGDTLASIARRHGVSIGELMRANSLGSERIVAGQRLVIPNA